MYHLDALYDTYFELSIDPSFTEQTSKDATHCWGVASRPAVRYLKERLVKFQCSTCSMVQEFLGPVIARKGPPKVYYQ